MSITSDFFGKSQFYAKGQLISKANFEIFIWTEKQTKKVLYFWPSL